jgi:TPR repeat protein
MVIKKDGDTLCKIARSYRSRRDLTNAFKWYHKAALENHIEAQYLVGYMYQYGDGVPENYTLAMEWFQKAASKGNTGAMMNIAEIHRKGLGHTASIYPAIYWCTKAAEKGDSNAMNELGDIFEQNQDVKDLQTAVD